MRSPLTWLAIGIWSLGILGVIAIGALITFAATDVEAVDPTETGIPTLAKVALAPTAAPSFTPRIITPTPRPTQSPTSNFKLPTSRSSPIPTLSIRVTLTATPSNPLVIGGSVLGRPLEVYRFGNGSIHRMIIGGIHGGNEYNTVHLADEIIKHLNAHPETIPSDNTFFILRNLNPDGYSRSLGIRGRTNENNVDLNRNFPSLWVASWNRNGCWTFLPTTAGASAGSEPETQSLIKFLSSSKIDALINYHSAALGIFAGGQPPDDASLKLAEAVSAVSDYPYPPIDTGCKFTGQLIDWASEHNIAALDIELTNHRDTDFEMNLRILDVLLKWRR
ncbi:MAG: M14 family metallopeptidase [Chloroflexota bacterium]